MLQKRGNTKVPFRPFPAVVRLSNAHSRLIHTQTHTHTNTSTYICTLSYSHTHSLSLMLTYSYLHTHLHSHFILSLNLSLSVGNTLVLWALIPTHTYTSPLTHTHPHSYTHIHQPTHIHIHTHTHTHTNTQTHILTHSVADTHVQREFSIQKNVGVAFLGLAIAFEIENCEGSFLQESKSSIHLTIGTKPVKKILKLCRKIFFRPAAQAAIVYNQKLSLKNCMLF